MVTAWMAPQVAAKTSGPAPRRAAAERGSAEAALHDAWSALAGVPDPEVPVVSIVELGIVRAITVDGDGLRVTLTPTYSGCPATEMIESAAREALLHAGFGQARIEYRLAPAWTTDWLAPEARVRLREFGIAPPGGLAHAATPAVTRIDVAGISPLRRAATPVPCPRCASTATSLLSQFGSTACKAQYRCDTCREPFDYFKPH
jgi:ring-1,2-phenylacetyl-CoA epoxidase subunit PaaD